MAIELDVVSNSKAAQTDMQRLRESVDNVGRSAAETNNSLKSFVSTLAVSAAGIGAITAYVTAFDKLANAASSLKVIAKSQEEFNRSLNATREIALNTFSALDDINQLYSSIARSTVELNTTQEQNLVITQNVARAIALSGANAQNASSAMLQFNQILSLGRIQGDELNVILQAAPTLLDSIARGLGKTSSEFQSMARSGNVSVKDLIKGVLSDTEKLGELFTRVNVTYGKAFSNLGTSSLLLFDAVSKALDKIMGGDGTGGLPVFINKVAISIANVAKGVDRTVLDLRYKFFIFFAELGNGLKTVVEKVKSVAELLGVSLKLPSIRLELPNLNIESFIPKLGAMQSLVLDWVKTVESAFAWLYDRVIGHSWVPDLVNGIINWFAKLVTSPLTFVRILVDGVDILFNKLVKVIPAIKKVFEVSAGKKDTLFGKDIDKDFLKTLGNNVIPISFALGSIITAPLLGVLSPFISSTNLMVTKYSLVLTGIATLISILNTSLTGVGKDDTVKSIDGLGILLKKSFKELGDSLRDNFIFRTVSKAFDNSNLGIVHTIKQVFGVRDKVPYKYSDPNSPSGYSISDTSSAVARGPNRNNQSAFANILNAFPVGWQVPIAAGLAAATLAAVSSVFSGASFLPILTIGIIAAFSTGMAKAIETAEIKRALSKTADFFLSILKTGMSFIFSDTLKNPFGLAAIIAKLSLILAAGTKGIAETVMTLAGIPNRIGKNIGNRFDLGLVDKSISNIDKSLGNVSGRLAESLTTSSKNYSKALATGSSSLIKVAEAQVNASKLNLAAHAAYTTLNSTAADSAARQQAMLKLDIAKADLQRAGLRTNVLTELATIDAARARAVTLQGAIKKQVDEAKAISFQSTVAAGSLIGGLAGSLLGFRWGEQFAQTLDGWSGWAREGAALGIALLGQLTGSAIGTVFATGLLSAAGGLAALITAAINNPLTYAIAAIVLAFAFILNYDSWKPVVFGMAKDLFDTLKAGFKQGAKDFSEFVVESIRTAFPMLDNAPGKPTSEYIQKNREAIAVTGAAVAGGAVAVAPIVKDLPLIINREIIRDAVKLKESIPAFEAAVAAARDALNIARSPIIIPGVSPQQAAAGIQAAESAVASAEAALANQRVLAQAAAEVASKAGSWRSILGSVESGISMGSILNNITTSVKNMLGQVNTAIESAVGALPKGLLPTAVAAVAATLVYMGIKSVTGEDEVKDTRTPQQKLKEAQSSPVPTVSEKLKEKKSIGTQLNADKPDSAGGSYLETLWSTLTKPFSGISGMSVSGPNSFPSYRRNVTGIIGGQPYNGSDYSELNTRLSDRFLYPPEILTQLKPLVKQAGSPIIGKYVSDTLNGATVEGKIGVNAELGLFDSYEILLHELKHAIDIQTGLIKPRPNEQQRYMSEHRADSLAKANSLFPGRSTIIDEHADFMSSVYGKEKTGDFVLKAEKPSATQTVSGKITPSIVTSQLNLDTALMRVEVDKRFAVVLDAITRFEGAKYGFNTNFGKDNSFKDLSEHPNVARQFKLDNGLTTSAAGAFMIQRDTWEEFRKMLKLKDFGGESQTAVAMALIDRAGAREDIMAGRMNATMEKLGKIWEGLPSSDKFKSDPKYWERAVGVIKQSTEAVTSGTSIVSGIVPDTSARDNSAARVAANKAKSELALDPPVERTILSDMIGFIREKKDATAKYISDLIGFKDGSPKFEERSSSTYANEMDKSSDILSNMGFEERMANAKDRQNSIFLLAAELNKIGIKTDSIKLQKLDDEKLADITDNVVKLINVNAQLEKAGYFTNKKTKLPTDLKKQIIEDVTGSKVAGVDTYVRKERFAEAREAGSNFAKSIQDVTISGLSDVLKGKITWKDYVKSLLDRFTSGIIDTFSKGLVESLLGGDGGIGKKIGDMAAGVFGLGDKIGMAGAELYNPTRTRRIPGVDSKYGNTVDDAADIITGGIVETEAVNNKLVDNMGGVFSKAWEGLSVIFSGAWSLLQTILSGFLSVFSTTATASGASGGIGGFFSGLFGGSSGFSSGFDGGSIYDTALMNFAWADGGLIKGPGTGISDSIAAMISNGEFVVNAAQTAKHLPLLHAINSGKIPRFATGGEVGTVSQYGFSTISNSKAVSSSQVTQEFNINITGDVSRQTRTEIQRMIPQIATGVNMANREKGNRR